MNVFFSTSIFIVAAFFLCSCSSSSPPPNSSRYLNSYNNSFAGVSQQSPVVARPTQVPVAQVQASRPPQLASTNRVDLSRLYRRIGVKKDLLPRRARGRTNVPMRPLYITIHSTQNWSKGADSLRHAMALKNGKLGRLSWHYTIDENRAVQHLRTTEKGNHADYDGPGNRYSIGLEMCEHPGNSRSATIEKTAQLAAYLMHKHKIPIHRVVPHYKWPRHGKRPANKNCPHFLLNNGRPGSKWRGFQAKVNRYYHGVAKDVRYAIQY